MSIKHLGKLEYWTTIKLDFIVKNTFHEQLHFWIKNAENSAKDILPKRPSRMSSQILKHIFMETLWNLELRRRQNDEFLRILSLETANVMHT